MDIPILLLKTRTQPNDGYEECFSSPGQIRFRPIFVPVLEHTPNTENLGRLEELLGSGKFRERYGGMVFTSQRAVEGWRAVVERVEASGVNTDSRTTPRSSKGTLSRPTTDPSALSYDNPSLPLQDTDMPFPLYVVGPATQRSLSTVLSSFAPTTTQHSNTNPSRFAALNPFILGSHTGSGATLAPFILSHYNLLQAHRKFVFWEAPRLPFIPLVGPGASPSKTAGGTVSVEGAVSSSTGPSSVPVRRGGMVRLERGDERLAKKPLLFLVGETRRDVIPKTLMDETLGDRRVVVEEVEVYSTIEKTGFGTDFEDCLSTIRSETDVDGDGRGGETKGKTVVVVVFSPQGCESMLRCLGYVDSQGRLTEKAERRWEPRAAKGRTDGGPTFVVATIGPTTRDYLRERFGFEADVCATKPSPEGVEEGVTAFLIDKKLV